MSRQFRKLSPPKLGSATAVYLPERVAFDENVDQTRKVLTKGRLIEVKACGAMALGHLDRFRAKYQAQYGHLGFAIG